MDLNDLRRALRRYWIPSAAAFCLTVVAGYIAATSGGPSFVSTSTIAVTPNPAEDGGIERVNFEIPVIVETVGSRSFHVQLAQALDANVLGAVNSLTATSETGTGIVRITAEGSDRTAVAAVVNAAAAAVIASYPASDSDPLTPATTGDLMVVDVIDEATEDGGSGRNNALPILLASVVLGAIIAGAVAALAQKSSRAFDVATRIRTEIGVPVLAVVPAVRELNADGIDLRELLTSGPPGLVEAFQTLRTRTEVLLRDVEPMVAVTSWQRGEGRTTITAGLGLLLAAVGQETVVIDADLRAPELDGRLGEPFGKGLSELAELDTADIVRETSHLNLGLVSAGVAEIHPAEILAIALPDTLDVIWKQSPHAVVVIDAPPLGPVQKNGRRVQRAAETWTVLRTADAVLLVVDASTAHLPEIAVSVERLQEDGVTVIGAVVNRRQRDLVTTMSDRDATPPTDRVLRLSAIVCTRNRSEWSTRAVQSLLDQDIPTSELEIVVVDNASTDDTASVLSELIAHRANFRYVLEPELGLSRARNRGIAETSGDVVAFLDDDAVAVPDWARRHLDCFRSDPEVVGTGGRIELGWPQDRPVWLPEGWEGMYAGLDLGDEPCEFTEQLIPFGANMAFRRRALAPGSGFAVSLGRRGDDLTSGEEREFFERLRAAGGRLVYLADAGVTHYVLPDRLGRRWFLRRVWAQGRSHVLIDLVLRPPRARAYWLSRSGYQSVRAGGQAVGWLATCVTRRSPARRMTRLARAAHAAGIAREALRPAIADKPEPVHVALSSVG